MELQFLQYEHGREIVQQKPADDPDLKRGLPVESQPSPGRIERKLAEEIIGIRNDTTRRVEERCVQEGLRRLAGKPLETVLQKIDVETSVVQIAREVFEMVPNV